MITFLEQVFEQIKEQNGNDWSRTLVLFPNNRSAYYFRELLKSNFTTGKIFPSLQTLEGLIIEQSAFEKADSFELTLQLFDTYKKHYPDTSLHHFLPVAKTMLADFSELDAELCDTKNFFRDLQSLKSMNVFMEEDEDKVFKYKYFWQAFQDCSTALQAYCKQQQKAYTGLLYRNVAENITDVSLSKDFVFFVGFTQLSNSEQKIVQHLLQHYKGDYLIDVDEWYLKDREHTAGISYRKIIAALKLKIPQFISKAITEEEKTIYIYPCNGKTQQIKTAFSILEQQAISEPDRNKTALILPDATLLDPLLANISDTYQDANISMGYPMKNALVIRLIKQLHLLLTYSKVFYGETHFHIRFLKQLFNFPLIRKGNEYIAGLPNFNNVVYVGLSRLVELTPEEPSLQTILSNPNDKDILSTALLQWLNSLHQEGLPTIEKLFLAEAKTIVQRVNESLHHFDSCTVEDYFLLLLDTLQTHSLPFDVDPNKGLQVMGIMESRNLDYEQVFVFSLNEGIFPANSKGNSYIPFELRSTYLTSPIEKDAISTYLFYRLLHRSKTIHLFYNTNQDAFAGGEPSRFLLQLNLQLAQLPNIHIQTYQVTAGLDLEKDKELEVVAKTPEILSQLRTQIEKSGLSPSALNTYTNCSIQFYYRYLLGIQPKDELDESIESDLLGSAVHYALEQLYKPFIGKNITATDTKSWMNTTVIEAHVKTHIAEQFDTKLLTGKNYLLYRVAVKLVLLFLKNETAALQEENALRLIALEQPLETTLTVDGHTVRLKGFADRIDEWNNTVRIADYKTGKSAALSLTQLDAEKLLQPNAAKQFQLLMYAWLYAKNNPSTGNIVSGIYWLRKSADYFNQLSIAKEESLTPQTLNQFEELLIGLIREILSPDVPYQMTQDEKRCSFCDFKNLCNRN